MRGALVDRAVVIWMAAALTVWACCLVILWGWAFDTSGASSLVTLAALLLAVAVAVALPGRAVRAIRKMARRLSPASALAAAVSVNGPGRSRPKEARATLRLLAAVAMFSALAAGVSTAAIFIAAPLVDALAAAVLLSRAAWGVCKLSIQLAGMFPLALGVAIAFLASAIVRIGSGRDVYATVFREWLWGASAGLAIFAVCWRLGANLLGIAATMAVGLLGAAIAILQRRSVTIRPGRAKRPIEEPGRLRWWTAAGTFGIVAAGLLVQLRLLGDVAGLGAAGKACWLAVSTVLLAGFLRRVDHKSRPPGKRQAIGATTGASTALSMQAALAITALAGGAGRAACLLLAAGLQIPIAAMAAVVLSRQRRLFAQMGGRARQYVSAVSAGSGLATLAYLLLLSVPSGPLVLLAVALVACASGALAGVVRAKRAAEQLRWAGAGTMLVVGLAAGILGAIGAAGRTVGPVDAGAWLTAARGPFPGVPARSIGVLPGLADHRGSNIDAVLREIVNRTGGRWLAAILPRGDVPPGLGPGVHVTVCWPDRAARPGCSPRGAADARRGGLFAAGHVLKDRFDGVLLSLVEPGHNQAWRFYNERTMRNLTRCFPPGGGLAILRMQSDDAGLATALAAAKSFQNVVGQCWLAAEPSGGKVDVLLVGPAGRVARPAAAAGMLVVPSRQLWYEWPRIRALRLASANRTGSRAPTVRDFVERLGDLQPD